jgi:hypothetical protein
MPIAPRLLETLDSLHEESPQVLDGSLSLADFWSRMGEVENLLKRACSTLAPLFGGGEGEALRLVSHLFSALRQELQFNCRLFPAVEAQNHREDGIGDIAGTVFSTLGACSGDLLDRHFRRIKVVVELVGVMEGSIDFAEESYLAFHEFVSPAIVGRLRERGDTLDA